MERATLPPIYNNLNTVQRFFVLKSHKDLPTRPTIFAHKPLCPQTDEENDDSAYHMTANYLWFNKKNVISNDWKSREFNIVGLQSTLAAEP